MWNCLFNENLFKKECALRAHKLTPTAKDSHMTAECTTKEKRARLSVPTSDKWRRAWRLDLEKMPRANTNVATGNRGNRFYRSGRSYQNLICLSGCFPRRLFFGLFRFHIPAQIQIRKRRGKSKNNGKLIEFVSSLFPKWRFK